MEAWHTLFPPFCYATNDTFLSDETTTFIEQGFGWPHTKFYIANTSEKLKCGVGSASN